ncbi:hypothetical protein ABEW05_003827 [Botrytis cinerea]
MPTPCLSTDFTFGVEFEFGVRFKEELSPEYTKLGLAKIYALIKETLVAETGLKLLTEAEIDQDSPDFFNPNKDPNKIYQADLFNTWALGSDSTVHFEVEEKADSSSMFVELELITPVMKFGAKALKDIQKMLTALKKHFDVIVNHSCGLHVHVGNGIEGLVKVEKLRPIEEKEAERKKATKKRKAEEKKARDAARAAGKMIDDSSDGDSTSSSSMDTLESGSLVF